MVRVGYRKNGETNKDVNQSFEKLGISDKHGWTPEMRTKYFKMASEAHKVLQMSDYTNKDIREKEFGRRDITKSEVKAQNSVSRNAPGIWSDSVFDSCKFRAEQLIKYVITKDEEKKRNGEKVKEIRSWGHIKHHHTRDFIHDGLKEGRFTISTADKYYVDLKKIDECNAKVGIMNSRQNKFIKESTREKIKEVYGQKTKESRVRSRKSDGSYGHSLEDAKKLINAAKDIRVKAAIEALVYQGYRKDTLFKLQWKDVVDKHGRIGDDSFIQDQSKMKAGRAQLIETNEASYVNNLYTLRRGRNNEDFVFGKNEDKTGFSPYQLEKKIKELCEATGVEWVGFHAFRSATVAYYEQEKFPKMTKEEVVQGILKMVNVEVMGKDGKLYKPHNQPKEKKEIVYDKNGKPVTRKNRYGGEYIVKRTVTKPDGTPVTELEFTYEKLISKNIEHLRNLYLAQQISHNRSDANAPYRNYDKK